MAGGGSAGRGGSAHSAGPCSQRAAQQPPPQRVPPKGLAVRRPLPASRPTPLPSPPLLWWPRAPTGAPPAGTVWGKREGRCTQVEVRHRACGEGAEPARHPSGSSRSRGPQSGSQAACGSEPWAEEPKGACIREEKGPAHLHGLPSLELRRPRLLPSGRQLGAHAFEQRRLLPLEILAERGGGGAWRRVEAALI